MEGWDVWTNLNVNVLNWKCLLDFQVESPVGDYKSLETSQEKNGLETWISESSSYGCCN